MGCNLYLEDERGVQSAELLDPRGYVNYIVQLASGSHTVCLQFIDPYGDTVFNRAQAAILIEELLATRKLATKGAIAAIAQRQFGPTWQLEADLRQLSAPAVQSHIDEMLALAGRCAAGIHMYLKFYGD